MAPPRVLVADDDRDFLDSVVRVTEYAGLEVVRATSGDELLEGLADHGPFELVITDVAMPWMTGLHVMLSARHAGWTTPVIVMSGLCDEQTVRGVIALGDEVSFLRKPFRPRDLYAALARSLRTGVEPRAARRATWPVGEP